MTLDVEGLPLHRDWHIVHLKERRLPRAAAAFKKMLIYTTAEVLTYGSWQLDVPESGGLPSLKQGKIDPDLRP
jgi:hypothetical protein